MVSVGVIGLEVGWDSCSAISIMGLSSTAKVASWAKTCSLVFYLLDALLAIVGGVFATSLVLILAVPFLILSKTSFTWDNPIVHMILSR